MRVVVVTPPAPVVTWADADAHLKLDGDQTDKALVETYIAGVTAHIDGPDGWLGRALGVQTLEARFDGFDMAPLRLPYPPLISVTSVSYIDAAGATQAIDGAVYEVFGSELSPLFGATWPSARWGRETVRVRYQAGYAVLPAPIRAAILLMVGDLYANRETTLDARASGAVAIPMSTSVENLLAPFRVYR